MDIKAGKQKSNVLNKGRATAMINPLNHGIHAHRATGACRPSVYLKDDIKIGELLYIGNKAGISASMNIEFNKMNNRLWNTLKNKGYKPQEINEMTIRDAKTILDVNGFLS